MENMLPFIPAVAPTVLPFVPARTTELQPLPAPIHQPSLSELSPPPPPIIDVEIDLALAELVIPPTRIHGFRVPATPCTECASRFNPWDDLWTTSANGPTHQRCA